MTKRPLAGATLKLETQYKLISMSESSVMMPVLFVGHGSPMNAIENNEFSNAWNKLGKTLPKPNAILCISAHWETKGTHVTMMEKPRTIHDFGGFPEELFAVDYPASGSKWLAQEIKAEVKKTVINEDLRWGLDHGCWSILKQMYPQADIPVIQLSLDYTKDPRYHYELAPDLITLRSKGVLIIGSGNMVHNLGMMSVKGNDINEPYGFDWAIEANETFKKLINANDHKPLLEYTSLGKAVQLAIPTPEHYLPMLYAIGLKQGNEQISWFNDKAVAGSLTMTSFIIDKE
jgi:4,5-DOPA dioxygenase extradiol